MGNDKQIKKKYSELAEDYDKYRFGTFSGKLLDKKQKAVLFKLLKDLPKSSRILEIGCGSGRFLEFLEKKGYKNLYGIDSSKEMLGIARKRTKAVLKKGDAYKLQFKNKSFDAVFSVHVLMHLENTKKFINEMLRVSKKIIIFDINNKKSCSFLLSKINKGYKPRFFSLEEIKNIIPSDYNLSIKPVYMFPIKGHLSIFYHAIALLIEKLAFFIGLRKYASQLFLRVESIK